jgi:hypothetical protein
MEADAGLTYSGAFLGTPAYAAPEQLRAGDSSLTPAADVYALGATLYHALALRPPFGVRSTTGALRQSESRDAPRLRIHDPGIARDVETIVAKAMDPDPRARYASASELADDLERLLDLQPIKARPGGVCVRLIKRMRRNRVALASALAGGAAVTALAVAIVVYLFIAPKLAKSHLDAARMSLLDQNQANAIFNLMFFQWAGETGTPKTRERWLASTAHALDEYTMALRWRPLDRSAALERDVVMLARTCLESKRGKGGRPGISQRIDGDAPTAALYVRRRLDTSSEPYVAGEEIERASPEDLRSLGLVAALLEDVDTALQAWSRMDLEGTSDAYVDAWLGVVLIADDQPARAYPRLRAATAGFPNVGVVHTLAAEAAAKCGDMSKAHRLIERARQMAVQDDHGGLERVEGLIRAMESPPEEAREIYRRLCRKGDYTSIRGRDYVAFLESQGDWRNLRLWAARLCTGSLNPAHAARCVRTSDEWWARLTLGEREQFVRSMAMEYLPDGDGWPWPELDFVTQYKLMRKQAATQGDTGTTEHEADVDTAAPWPFLARATFDQFTRLVNITEVTFSKQIAEDPGGWPRAVREWTAGHCYPP